MFASSAGCAILVFGGLSPSGMVKPVSCSIETSHVAIPARVKRLRARLCELILHKQFCDLEFEIEDRFLAVETPLDKARELSPKVALTIYSV